MPYTLMMGWAWVLLGVLLGLIIGWLLRSIAAKRQVKRARKKNVDAADVVRLRGRIAELEQAAAERDLLKAELDNYGARTAPSITQLQGIASTAGAGARESARGAVERNAVAPPIRVPEPVEPESAAPPKPAEPGAGGPSVGVSKPAEPGAGGPSVGVSKPAEPGAAAPTLPARPGDAPVLPASPPTPDVSQARAVLGAAIQLDDLKVVEGIGPKIESLCQGIGIHTWFDLSTTEVSLLRTMLADAGPRYKTHNPSTWPDQAALLAAGRWDDFKALTDGLRGGRVVD